MNEFTNFLISHKITKLILATFKNGDGNTHVNSVVATSLNSKEAALLLS